MGARLALALLPLLALAAAAPAHAKGLLVSPSSFHLTTPAAAPVEAHLLLRPATEEPTRVALHVEPFGIDADGKPRRGERSARSLPERTALSATLLVLQPRGERVTLRFTPPEEAEGSYWVAVALEVEPVTRRGASGEPVDVVTRLVVPVFVTIEGSERPHLTIEELAADGGAGGVGASALLFNDGNTVVVTSTFFTLEEAPGDTEVAAAELRDLVLLPGSARRVRASLVPFPGAGPPRTVRLFVPFGRGAERVARAACAPR